MTYLPRLYIYLNQKFLLLGDVTVKNGVALGTLLRGSETNRLFHHTLTRDLPAGKQTVIDLRDRPIVPVGEQSWFTPGPVSRLQRSPLPGAYRVDITTCG